MRKSCIGLCVFGMTIFNITHLSAGNIDNKHNWSAEYFRTLNRNAATDSADIAVYNPAGIMKMENGAYMNLSVHGCFKTYENTVNGTEFESDTPSYVPAAFAIYKQNKWAAFAGFTIPAGGGKVEFDDGNATTMIAGQSLINAVPALTAISSQKVDAQSYYLGFTLGGAYAINDLISLSLAARYIDASIEFEGLLTVTGLATSSHIAEYEKKADGWGGILGINLSPTDTLNIGIRYETGTRLNFEYEVTSDTPGIVGAGLLAMQSNPITNGKRARRDLPAILGFGVSQQYSPKLRIEANLTYYFNESADWEGDENLADNGYDTGIAFEWTFNEKIKGSLGYMYTEIDIEPEAILAEAPQLGASTIGAGFVYKPKPTLDLNFAAGTTFYRDDSYIDTSSGTPLTIEYDKDIFLLAFGVQYKFI